VLQEGGKQVQTMDLDSSSRRGYGLGTLKTRFARCTAVYNLLTVSVCTLPYRNTHSMAQQIRGYGARLQYFLDCLSLGAHSLQSLLSVRHSLPLGLRAQPSAKATEPKEDKFIFDIRLHGANRLTGCESPGKIGAL